LPVISRQTTYERSSISATKLAKSKTGTELGLKMKDKDLRFEVLSEDEWEAKLNEILKD